MRLRHVRVIEVGDRWHVVEAGRRLRRFNTAAAAARALRREDARSARGDADAMIVTELPWEPTTPIGRLVARAIVEG